MIIQHQTHNTTEKNRYPKIFNFISKNYKFNNILSFGCSSGEECQTLSTYFKYSNIIGIDSNEEILNKAINSNNNNLISYYKNINYISNIDCVFAMSVFCRHPESYNINYNYFYNFNFFNKEILNLDKILNVGGLFVIFNSNYFFLDTEVSYKYDIVTGDFEKEFVSKFNKDGYASSRTSPIIFIKK